MEHKPHNPLFRKTPATFRRRIGFTLIELMISVGIIGVLAGITITAVGPKKILLAAHDSERKSMAEQLQKARTQMLIDHSDYVDTPAILNGKANATPICEYGATRDSSCINMDYLVDNNYISSIKKDSVELCDWSGYKIYKDGNQYTVFSAHTGQLNTSDSVAECVTDTISPDFSAIGSSLYADTATITWNTDELANAQVEYGVNGTYQNVSAIVDTDPLVLSHSIVISGLQGYTTYTFRVKSRDAAGNLGASKPFSFTTDDTTAPVITSVTPTAVTDETVTITWTTDEPSKSQAEYWTATSAHMFWPVTPDATLTTNHSVTIEGLDADTDYTFIVGSRDAKGNLGLSDPGTFRTLPDTTPPVVSIITTSNITSTDATISWTTNEKSTTRIEYGLDTGYGTWTTLSGALVTSHQQTLVGLTTDQSYHYRVHSIDKSGNEAVSDDKTVTIHDTTPPSVGPMSLVQNYGTGAILTWTTNELSDTQVKFGTGTTYGTTSTLDSTPTLTHSVTLNYLTPKTLYHVLAKSRDPAGNAGSGSDFPFTTVSLDPTISGVSTSSMTTIDTVLNWTTNRPATSQIYYSTSPNPSSGSGINAIMVTTHAQRVLNLTPSTTYYYTIRSADSHGYLGTASGTFVTNTPYVSGMVAYWALEETSGTTSADLSGNAQTAAQTNGPTNTSNAAPTTFSNTRSLNFDGSNDYLLTPNLNRFFTANGTSTWSLWFYPKAAGVLISEQSTTSPGTASHTSIAEVETNGQVKVRVYNIGIITLGSVSFNTWNHLVIRYSKPGSGAGTFDGFLNGVKSSALSGTRTLFGTMYFYYGLGDSTNLGTGNYFNGMMDDIRIYSTALTDPEVAVLAASTGAGDTTPPSLTSTPIVSGITSSTATITWNTNEASDTQVYFGTGSNPSTLTGTTTLVTSGPPFVHSYQLKGIVAGKTYYYRVASRDGAGNPYVDSSDRTFVTPADSTGPVFSSIGCTSLSPTSVTLTWNTDEPADTEVWYGYTNPPTTGNPAVSTLLQTHSVTLTGLTSGATFYYKLRGKDRYGNQSTQPSATACAPDALAPTISNVQVTSATPTAAIISWTTNENASTIISFGNDTNYTGSGTAMFGGLLQSHTGSLTNLTPGHTYHYKVKSADASGNITSWSDLNFNTPSTTNGPYLQYSLDENTGTATSDSSGNGNNAILTNGPTWTTGRNGSAVLFDGVDDFINAKNPPALQLFTGTVSVWVKTSDGGAGFRGIITKQNAYAIFLLDNTFCIYDWGGGTQRCSSVNVADGTWHHLVFTFQSGVTNGTLMYVDGTLRTTTTMAVANQRQNLGIATGNASANTQNFKGTIDDARIYNRVLSAGEVSTLFTTGDTTAPTLIQAPSFTINSPTSVTVTWKTDEPSDTQIFYSTSPNPTVGTTKVTALVGTHSQTISPISANTVYYYRVRSADGAGNLYASPSDLIFSTDSTPPVISNIASSVPSTTATITWTTNENASTIVEYGLDTQYGSTGSTLNSVTSHSQALTGLASNTLYHYRVKSRDPSGNLATSGDNWFTTIDTDPPVLSPRVVTIMSDTSAKIDWTTNENSTTQIEYGLSAGSLDNSTSLDSSLTTTHSQTVTGLLPNSTYYFHVKSRDAAGNLATSGTENFVTTDSVPPSISNVSTFSITENHATVAWTTNESSDTTVEYGTTPSYGTPVTTANSVTSHTQTLTGLIPNTTYYYRVKSKDASNNTGTSSGSTFTTLFDSTPPVVSAVGSSNVTDTTAQINWTTNELADSQIDYGLTTSYNLSNTLDPTLTTSHSQTLTGLGVNKLYHYRVKSHDGFGNLGYSTGDNTFTTVDTAAPVVSNVSAAAQLGETSAVITWTTDEISNSQVEYGISTSYGTYSTIDSSLVTNHSQLISPLTANTKYYYRVKSRDGVGNLTTTTGYFFFTDITPPVVAGATVSGITGSTASFSWTTGEASTTWMQYRPTGSPTWTTSAVDSSLVTSHTRGLSGLTPDISYDYRLLSTDWANNTGTGAGTFSTDGTPPVISAVSVPSGSLTATSAHITWTTNESATTRVEFGTSLSYGTFTTLDSSLLLSHDQVLTPLSPGTQYYFRVLSSDAAGNAAQATGTFTTP